MSYFYTKARQRIKKGSKTQTKKVENVIVKTIPELPFFYIYDLFYNFFSYEFDGSPVPTRHTLSNQALGAQHSKPTKPK